MSGSLTRRAKPEAKIQAEFARYLTARGWLVEQTHGSRYQSGFPDLFLAHRAHGQRWVDCKNPKAYSLTRAQQLKWPAWERAGVGIWIITGATQDDYDRLFGPPNWRDYWRQRGAFEAHLFALQQTFPVNGPGESDLP